MKLIIFFLKLYSYPNTHLIKQYLYFRLFVSLLYIRSWKKRINKWMLYMFFKPSFIFICHWAKQVSINIRKLLSAIITHNLYGIIGAYFIINSSKTIRKYQSSCCCIPTVFFKEISWTSHKKCIWNENLFKHNDN